MSLSEADAPPDAAAPSEVAASPPPIQSSASFVGKERAFFGLLLRGAVGLMLTLGLYRFWLATDVRRFLWGHTIIGEDGLEYVGTPRELLVGFLTAIALLIPVYLGLFVAALGLGMVGQFSGVFAFLLLAFLGQFAIYRARRYRLTRTVYRGIRWHQTGSAWKFAVYSSLWWGLIALSLGLAYPWAQASLERYKLANTHYGDVTGRFVGSGGGLFLRGFLMWLVVMAPLAFSTVIAFTAVDWVALATATVAEGNPIARIEAIDPDFAAAIVVAIAGIGWSVFAAALLYPLFRTMVLRWWISGIRLGGLTVVSHVRAGQIYTAYARFLWYMFLFGIIVAIFAAVVVAIGGAIAGSESSTGAQEVIAAILFVAAYVIAALGYSTIYQSTVTIRIWRLSFETSVLRGLSSLDKVTARGVASSALGEGLADALDVGGI